MGVGVGVGRGGWGWVGGGGWGCGWMRAYVICLGVHITRTFDNRMGLASIVDSFAVTTF